MPEPNQQREGLPEGVKLDREHPFPGLEAFGEADARHFYGRERETEELVRLVQRAVLSVLFGDSGLGKTSLLNAGVFPKLRELDYLPVQVRLRFGTEVDPVSQIAMALDETLRKTGVEGPLPQAGETLWEFFHRARFWSRKNRLLTPVLIFDQFEEIFTHGEAEESSALLVTALSDLVENQIPQTVRDRILAGEDLDFSYEKQNFRIVLSLREDFLPDLEGLRAHIPSVRDNRFRLTRLSGRQAMAIILGLGSHLVSEPVAGEIVRFAAGDGAGEAVAPAGPDESGEPGPPLEELEIEPALLSLFCRELNERRLSKAEPQITSALVARSKQQIVADFYAKCLAGRPFETVPGRTRDWQWLVAWLGSALAFLRHRGRWLWKRPFAIRPFIEERLITRAVSRGGDTEAKAFRRFEPVIEAVGYRGITEDDLRLLVDRRLLRRDTLKGVPHIELMHDVLCPVVKAARDRRRVRRKRIAAFLRSGKLLLLLAAAVLAWLLFQKYCARPAPAPPVERPEVAVSVTADRLAWGGEAGELKVFLAESGETAPRTLEGLPGQVTSVAFDRSGRWLASGHSNGALRLWRIPEGDRIERASGAGGVSAVAFGPHGRYLASGHQGGEVQLWSLGGEEGISARGDLPLYPASAARPSVLERGCGARADREPYAPGTRPGVVELAFWQDARTITLFRKDESIEFVRIDWLPEACRAPAGRADTAARQRIDFEFEDLPAGSVVDTIYGDRCAGPVRVWGVNPRFAAPEQAAPEINAAILFDTESPTGGDFDLGTPNEAFGGPGRGAGGATGAALDPARPPARPLQVRNDRGLGKALTVGESLRDANGDGQVDVPNDEGEFEVELILDFCELGSATLHELTLIDVDLLSPPTIELFDRAGARLGVVGPADSAAPIPLTENNGVVRVPLGGVAGVGRVFIDLPGSTAVDEVVFQPDSGR